MTVQLLLGRRGSGKTYQMMSEIKEKIVAEPLGDPVILIAPKQTTFSLEQSFAADPAIKGSLRASVYGFDRLAWRIMSEEGGLSEEMISKAGIEMLTYLTLKNMQDELILFGTSAKYYGFSQKLTETIKEFKKYNVSPDALMELSRQDVAVRTQHKLHDIGLIYGALEEQLAGLYIQSEDIMQFLYELIPASRTIRHADIYIDGFHNFTTIEYVVLQQLAKYAKSMTLTLTLDPSKENETFRKTRETMDLLVESLQEINIPVEITTLKDVARYKNPSLKVLEQQFDALLPAESPVNGITLNEADHMRTETDAIVRTIHKKARTGEFRYAEMAVLYRDTSYIPLVKSMFDQYEIPFYTDDKEQMIHHPAIELIRSLLDFVAQPWQNDHLFRALKTGLLSRRFDIQGDLILIDMLENTVIERGLSFNRWLEDDRFFFDTRKPYSQENWETMNTFRQYVTKLLLGFTEQIKAVERAEQFAALLYNFLVEIKIPDYLMAEKDRFVQLGMNEEALKNEQVYEGIIDVMDDFVEMLGDEPLDFQTMKEMFDVGLVSLEFSSIPQALDEIQLLNLDLARIENIPCVFICGFNEEVLPRMTKDNGLITDQDKTMIESSGVLKLAPSSVALTMDESFVAYQALTHASTELHIYYSLMGEDGSARRPSSYINQLKAIFPELSTHVIAEDTRPEQLVETVRTGIPYIISHLEAPEWYAVAEWMKRIPVFNEVYRLKDYTNATLQLSEQRSVELYGEEIKASVSRFESYNNCPFQHFAAHGLRLNERTPFEFQHFELGNIFHHALKLISEEIKDSIITMSKESLRRYVEVTLKDLLPEVQYQVLYSRAYYQFMINQITKILTETLTALQFQQSRSQFRMAKFEQSFNADPSRRDQFAVQKLYTNRGIPISIRGQIDRIDVLEGRDKDYVSIIDYKSSSHELDLREVYYGKQMQMLTYMDVALQNDKKITAKRLSPAAMLYFHVKAPMLNYNNRNDIKDHELSYLEQFRLQGFIVDDLEIASKLDTTLDVGVKSAVIPAKLKKDGTFYSSSRTLSEREIRKLIDINRHNFVSTAEHIMDGHTKVAPLEFGGRLPCQFCAFKSTCHIDPLINAQDVRTVDESIDVKAILKEDEHETETH
ncbi:helicase-exonuclease AddAB subunit AddB [Macrococcus equipercicus]|uniref:Helicase-exonuclease AddAB subunit AddB n=1 Tax=Macrococcus equipercicus TaxID=69967 RepID=A0ABQ6RBJ4_9STAP|nr:helicase-exonuclease AddAB subunit AddB [Macrococcus equipercicus]KAA1042571.1 helicase-exonuclease AddAB subunit AddB [Macrococcus equipercicus]